jgi:ESCRT-I complex subunit VPS28
MGRRNYTGAFYCCLSLNSSDTQQTRIQAFITFLDALKLNFRAKDQLHPLLQELVTGYARFPSSKEWEGRSKLVGWLITLNGMKASEELGGEQTRQVSI